MQGGNLEPSLDLMRSNVTAKRKGTATGLLLCLVFALLSQSAWAHKVSSVSLIAHLDTGKGVYLLDAAMEVVPSVEQELNDQISPEDAARTFAEDYLVVLFDEVEVKPELEITIETASDKDTPEELQRQQVLVKMTGDFPEEAEKFLLYLDPSCPMAVVMVVLKDEKPSRRMQVILAGEYSRPVDIAPIEEGDPFDKATEETSATAAEKSGETSGSEEKAGEVAPVEEGGDGSAFLPAIAAGWTTYFAWSLLPILLLLSLFLVTLEKWPLFYQVAAILVGQSLAIALAAWRILPNPDWIGMLAGALLAILSVEVWFQKECRWWRLLLAGVAGVASGLLIVSSPEFGSHVLDRTEGFLLALVGFIGGAEFGLAAVGLIAAGVFLFLSRFNRYARSVVQPLSALLAAYGIYVIIERFL